MAINRCSSGSSDSISGSDHFYYNTINNTLRFIESSGNVHNAAVSLPIAIIKMSGDGALVTSIDQVFNGLGYIGSAVFALPGVKGLAPDGRNEDGSLKNIELNLTNVLTRTLEATFSDGVLCVSNNAVNVFSFSNNKPISGKATYQEDENQNYLSLVKTDYSFQGRVTTSSGVITSFQPKTTFRAVDYSEVKSIVSSSQSIAPLMYSSTVNLLTNNIYTITLSGNVTFSLPQATAGILNQIEIQLYMPSVYTIDLGTTTYFGGEAPDISEAGYYTIIYEYDNIRSVWVVGSLKKASV